MSQPLAIYASIPATVPPTAGPNWEGTQPVTVADPFRFWPSLDWRGDNIVPGSPVTEAPQYLWIVPVADPSTTVSVNFVRRWDITPAGAPFDTRAIPAGTYDIAISFAADDQYVMQLFTTTTVFVPTGANSFVPPDFPWRNVKTYQYSDITLNQGDILRLSILATNIGQPVGTAPQDNPAMFSWTMQLVGED
ncbi:MAG TPA: hypothetical protein VHY08_22105 [Bacillota bacterium]|nr:hypothetical protein [Bacillota bacterium]